MMNEQKEYYPNIADIIYGNYIRYDRLFEMTKYAFYGKTDSESVNIFVDIYSMLKNIYTRGDKIQINDSYAIASCIINLGIHLRAYFETRHRVMSKVYLVYGGARPNSILSRDPFYNNRNIQMEDSNGYIHKLVLDNMELIKILCPYLDDIFAVVDYENEFNVLVSSIIDDIHTTSPITPNIIYSKDQLSYQLVAFKPRTFLYRPKKKMREDASWVVTKSTLYNAYRYGELSLTKQIDCNLDIKMFSIYQALSGVKSRSMKSYKNANTSIKLLNNAIESGVFNMGYDSGSILRNLPAALISWCNCNSIPANELFDRLSFIDINYQTMIFKSTPECIEKNSGLINLYNPQEVRNINDKYFQIYPLDLNRV